MLYGIASSTEVAYYTYIYAKVDRENYKKVTSYTYTAILVGNFAAASLSQLLVSWKWMNYQQLHLLTLGSVSIALLISFVLPGVDQSIYFYRNESPVSNDGFAGSSSYARSSQNIAMPDLSFQQRIKRAYIMLWMDCKKAYSNPYVVKWSVWWAIASAGFYQVSLTRYYIQISDFIYVGQFDNLGFFLTFSNGTPKGYKLYSTTI